MSARKVTLQMTKDFERIKCGTSNMIVQRVDSQIAEQMLSFAGRSMNHAYFLVLFSIEYGLGSYV